MGEIPTRPPNCFEVSNQYPVLFRQLNVFR